MTVKFLRDTAERAVKTFAQTLLAGITIGAAITDIDWESGAAIAGTAAVVSILTSVVSGFAVGDPDSASALPEK